MEGGGQGGKERERRGVRKKTLKMQGNMTNRHTGRQTDTLCERENNINIIDTHILKRAVLEGREEVDCSIRSLLSGACFCGNPGAGNWPHD